jgi:hypothetical protein
MIHLKLLSIVDRAPFEAKIQKAPSGYGGALKMTSNKHSHAYKQTTQPRGFEFWTHDRIGYVNVITMIEWVHPHV